MAEELYNKLGALENFINQFISVVPTNWQLGLQNTGFVAEQGYFYTVGNGGQVTSQIASWYTPYTTKMDEVRKLRFTLKAYVIGLGIITEEIPYQSMQFNMNLVLTDISNPGPVTQKSVDIFNGVQELDIVFPEFSEVETQGDVVGGQITADHSSVLPNLSFLIIVPPIVRWQRYR